MARGGSGVKTPPLAVRPIFEGARLLTQKVGVQVHFEIQKETVKSNDCYSKMETRSEGKADLFWEAQLQREGYYEGLSCLLLILEILYFIFIQNLYHRIDFRSPHECGG